MGYKQQMMDPFTWN